MTMARPEYNDDDARQNLLDDYAALADENSATIDRLQTLADTQAAIIAAKNDEIAQLRAELARCQSHDYADDICNDCEDGGQVAPAMVEGDDDAIIRPPINFAANGWG
jgi:hypothetical protein